MSSEETQDMEHESPKPIKKARKITDGKAPLGHSESKKSRLELFDVIDALVKKTEKISNP